MNATQSRSYIIVLPAGMGVSEGIAAESDGGPVCKSGRAKGSRSLNSERGGLLAYLECHQGCCLCGLLRTLRVNRAFQDLVALYHAAVTNRDAGSGRICVISRLVARSLVRWQAL